MFYKVMKKYQRGPSLEVAAFVAVNDAKLFIQSKLQQDIEMKVNVVYQLCEGQEVVEEFTQDNMDTSSGGGRGMSGQQASSGERFNPTPLSTTLRPPGMPQNWQKEEDKKKE